MSQKDNKWSWDRILDLVAKNAGWPKDRFRNVFGDDGYALDRFLEAVESEDPDAYVFECLDPLDDGEAARTTRESHADRVSDLYGGIDKEK